MQIRAQCCLCFFIFRCLPPRSLKAQLRAALTDWRSNQARQAESARLELLGPDSEGAARRRLANRTRTEEDALRASETATDAMRRVRELMAAEVEHGSNINEELISQGHVIESAAQEHGRINATVGVGRGLIARMKRREFTDKLLVTLAFLVFFSVCVYIIRARLRLLPFGLFSSWI